MATMYENVVTLDKNEIKNITFENTKYDASTVAHIEKCERIAKALTDEIERHKTIVKENENKLSGNKLVHVEHKERPQFSKTDFISVYGEEEYKRFCYMIDVRSVVFGG